MKVHEWQWRYSLCGSLWDLISETLCGNSCHPHISSYRRTISNTSHDHFYRCTVQQVTHSPTDALYISVMKKVKVKRSRYRPDVAQRVGRGIALLFNDRGTGRGWVVSSTPRPHFTPSKDPVPILQEAGWAPGPVWTGEKTRRHRDSIPDRPPRSQSLYRLSYRAHISAL